MGYVSTASCDLWEVYCNHWLPNSLVVLVSPGCWLSFLYIPNTFWDISKSSIKITQKCIDLGLFVAYWYSISDVSLMTIQYQVKLLDDAIYSHNTILQLFLFSLQCHHPDVQCSLGSPVCGIQPNQQTFDWMFAPAAEKWKQSDSCQLASNVKLLNTIAQDMLPLCEVEIPAIHNYIDSLNPRYQMPSRKHLSDKLLPERAN